MRAMRREEGKLRRRMAALWNVSEYYVHARCGVTDWSPEEVQGGEELGQQLFLRVVDQRAALQRP